MICGPAGVEAVTSGRGDENVLTDTPKSIFCTLGRDRGRPSTAGRYVGGIQRVEVCGALAANTILDDRRAGDGQPHAE